jgi:hypothetical protein
VNPRRKLLPEELASAARVLQRRAIRAAKHEAKHVQYHKNGLNGPRALARRRLQKGLR